MQFRPEHAEAVLPHVDPARVWGGRPVGLRDGALLALFAAGLTVEEIAGLQASAVTMERGNLLLTIQRGRIPWTGPLPTDLGGRLLVWLVESRLWAADKPLFANLQGEPLTQYGIYKLLDRAINRRHP